MKIVNVRSPFIIEVNQSGQVGSKIELSIWNKGNPVPSSGAGFYSLSKAIPSATQINNSYNISNYVREFIENIKPNNYDLNPGIDIYADNIYEWVNFKVTRFWYNGTTYTSLGSTDYVGVNGYVNYSNGYQTTTDSVFNLLTNTNINFNYYKNTYTDLKMEYVNLLIDRPATTTTSVKYERIDGTVFSFTTNFLIGQIGIYNMKIPITPIIYDVRFINGCKVTVTSTPSSGSPVVYVFYTYPIEECKYTPVRCSFINRYGGWKDLIFFKAQTNSISVKGTEYKLTQSAINYNTAIGQFKTFNTNGKQTVKLNTGWVDENYSELITDLLLSETVLLDSKPVTVKTSSSDFKTNLKDKNINYELEFEYAFNLINDAV